MGKTYTDKSTYKADAKGRAVGLSPGREYHVFQEVDGTLRYVPAVPFEFQDVREVSKLGFESFFGCTPEEVSSDSLQAVTLGGLGEEFYSGAVAFQQFTGKSEITGVRNKRDVLVKIRKGV